MCVRLSPKGGHPKLCLNHCSAGELVVSMSLDGVVRVKVSEETGTWYKFWCWIPAEVTKSLGTWKVCQSLLDGLPSRFDEISEY